MREQISLQGTDFISFGIGNGIAEAYGSSTFNLARNLHIGCTSLPFYQQHTRVLFLYILTNVCNLLSFERTKATLTGMK